MIDFSKAYNRADFVNYLRRDFLPDDFEQEEKECPVLVTDELCICCHLSWQVKNAKPCGL